MAKNNFDNEQILSQDCIAILYIDPKTNNLEHAEFTRFGDTWTNPNGKYKIEDEKTQKEYADTMSQLSDKGENGLMLYETLKQQFCMPPEKKVNWSLADLLKLFSSIENNNACALVRASRKTFPEFYKFLTLFFDEGEAIYDKSSGWTAQQIQQLQELYVDYVSMINASLDEKLHFQAFFSLRDNSLSSVSHSVLV